MKAPKSDRYSALHAAHGKGAIILANEGRHGRPDHYHTVGDATRTPKYTCEPHEYVAVVPYSNVAELVEAAKALMAGSVAQAVAADHADMPESDKADAEFRASNARDAMRAALARFGVTP